MLSSRKAKHRLFLAGRAADTVRWPHSVLFTFGLLACACLLIWPGTGNAQSDRDFLFDDEEGHRVLRFSGVGPEGLSEQQIFEVSNAEFSSMVHDRIRADLRFDAEPVDAAWSELASAEIAQFLSHAGRDFTSHKIECRSASCRITLEHTGLWTLATHTEFMTGVQRRIETFIQNSAPAFRQSFLITAYFQELEPPHIKVFLERAE